MKLILSTGLFLLAFASLSFSQPANIYTFEPDVRITDAPLDEYGTSSIFFSSGQHYTAFRGDTVYVVWWESRTSFPPTGNHVFLARSTDAGRTFGPAIRVNDLPSGFNPSMRVDSSGIIYVAYERQDNIYFTKSTDGGATFTPSILVVDPAGLDSIQSKPSLAVNDKGHIHIAWFDRRTKPAYVFTASSYDGGQSFGPNVRAGDSLARGGSGFDIGADDSGRVYVVLFCASDPSRPNQFPIRLARSDDSGQTFQLRGLVTDFPMDTTTAFAFHPSMAVGDGVVGVAWDDSRTNEQGLGAVRFSSSSDYGETFSASQRVNGSVPLFGSNRYPSTNSRRGIFYVGWGDVILRESDSNYIYNTFLTYTSNRGQTFAPIVGADTTGRSFATILRPSLSVNEAGTTFSAWIDDREDPVFQIVWRIFGATAIPHYVKGDLNLDSLLTTVDVVMELNAVFLAQPYPAPFGSADVNCDTKLTAADVVLHLNATYLVEPFPC